MKEANRPGGDFFGRALEQFGESHLVQRLDHTTTFVDPLVGLEASPSGHERFRELEVEVVKVVTPLATDFEDVAKPARGEKRGYRTLPLHDRVRDERGPMNDARGGYPSGVMDQEPDAVQHGPLWFFGSREELVGPELL